MNEIEGVSGVCRLLNIHETRLFTQVNCLIRCELNSTLNQNHFWSICQVLLGHLDEIGSILWRKLYYTIFRGSTQFPCLLSKPWKMHRLKGIRVLNCHLCPNSDEPLYIQNHAIMNNVKWKLYQKSKNTWAIPWENLLMPYANNKGADQLAHLGGLISAFVVRCFHSIIPLVSISEILSFYLASEAEQPGLRLTWLQTPKTGFLVTRLTSNMTKKWSVSNFEKYIRCRF